MLAGRRNSDLAFIVALAAVSAAALVVFAPWRPPGFVSDSWYLIARYGPMSPADHLARLIPNASEVYRPLTNIGYWLEWHAFGLNTAGHFAIQIGAHVLGAVLIAAVTMQLTKNRFAALVAGVAFLFAPQANETVWDYSSLHRVLSAVAVPASVLAYVRGQRGLALLAAAAALLIDEAGVLVLALVGTYELLFHLRRTTWRADALAAAWRLAPIIAITLLYAGARLAVGGAYNYVQPCRTVTCQAVGAAEYLNRLAVRGDDLLALLWTQRPLIMIIVVSVGLVFLALAAPWRWPDWRPFALGLAWAALGSALYLVTLWPYVADRFVYVPAMGAALAIGAALAGVLAAWSQTPKSRRYGLVLAGVVLLAWLSAGPVTLADRGRRWVASAEAARVLAADLYALLPAPAPGTQVLVYDVPRMQPPLFPPGNTGPYMYMNGMGWAMRVRYGWPADVALPTHPELHEVPDSSVVIEFEVVDGHVVPRTTD
jgi:hypothetical protein